MQNDSTNHRLYLEVVSREAGHYDVPGESAIIDAMEKNKQVLVTVKINILICIYP